MKKFVSDDGKIVAVDGKAIHSTSKGGKAHCFDAEEREVGEEKFLSVIREHWKIESLHWIFDVFFGEDDCNFHSDQTHITRNIWLKLGAKEVSGKISCLVFSMTDFCLM